MNEKNLLAHRLRVTTTAAEILEREAYALKECSTVDGNWLNEVEAKADYSLMMRTARELRDLCR